MSDKRNTPKKKVDPVLEIIDRVTRSLMYGSVFLFLIANIISSQDLPELYFHYVSHPQETIISLLQKARMVEGFDSLLPEVRQIMSSRSDEILADANSRDSSIEALQQILLQSPQNPEVLFALSELYRAQGDEGFSEEYLRQAQLYDPTIGN